MVFPFLSSKKSPSSESARGAQRYEAMAETALDAGDLDTAIECYRAALEIAPFNNGLRMGLADALMMKADQNALAKKRKREERESSPTLPRSASKVAAAEERPSRRSTRAPQNRSVAFHEPRPVVKSSRTQEPLFTEELAEQELDFESAPDTRAPGMSRMDDDRAREKKKSRMKLAQVSWEDAEEDAPPRRGKARRTDDEAELLDEPVRRPQVRHSTSPTGLSRSRSRFVLMAALYSGLLLVLVGVAHGLITNAMGDAPLPQPPKVQAVPDGVSLALEQATRELMRGAPSQSVTILETALTQHPDHKDLLNAALARSLRASGNKQLDARNYAKAAEEFERATRVDPLNADNWIELGRSYREHGRSVQAGNSAESKKLLERSREAYNRALDVTPGDPAALVGVAQVYGFLGERQKAVESYKLVVTNSPESREASLARQHLAQLVGES